MIVRSLLLGLALVLGILGLSPRLATAATQPPPLPLTFQPPSRGPNATAARLDRFFSSSGHTNNWAVLVCTSRFWFNYRHAANVLSIYRTVKRLGVPDSNIILMLPDDFPCNPRNERPGSVFNNAERRLDLYGENVEVDYRGYEVTVENFIRVLTGRHDPSVPRSKRLLTDDRSNVLVYMTGHGGDEFLKFQDSSEISSWDIADAFEQMWEKRRYHEILFMVDTCQANTLFERFYSPNIVSSGSSSKDESSYSHHLDMGLGVHVIDRYTYFNLEVLERMEQGSKETLAHLFATYNPAELYSTPGHASSLSRPLHETLLTDFFGAVLNVEITREGYPIEPTPSLSSESGTSSTSLPSRSAVRTSAPVTFPPDQLRVARTRLTEVRPMPETELVTYRFVGVAMLAGVLVRVAVGVERKAAERAAGGGKWSKGKKNR